MVDKSPSRDVHFSGIQARSLDGWVDQSTVDKCFECNVSFQGLFGRWRHHCRLCGRVFCQACASCFILIPAYVTRLPVPNDRPPEPRDQPMRVCDNCHDRLKRLDEITSHVKTNYPTTHPDSDQAMSHLDTLERMAHVDTEPDSLVRQWANHKLSVFREIQYCLPGHVFSEEEKQMLWINRRFLVHHNQWLVQLLKSVDFTVAPRTVLDEVDQILRLSLEKPRDEKSSCWRLMCSRRCQPQFDVGCALQVLNQTVRYNPIRQYALSFLDQSAASYDRLQPHIPYLVRHSLYAPVVYKWLIQKCAADSRVASETYWELQTYLPITPTSSASNGRHMYLGQAMDPATATSGGPIMKNQAPVQLSLLQQVVQEALAEWKQVVAAEVQEKVLNSHRLVDILRGAYRGPAGPDGVAKTFATLQKNHYFFPVDISRGPYRVDYANIQVKGSYTAPVVIPTVPLPPHGTGGGGGNDENDGSVKFLLKPCDIRKEQAIINIIRVMRQMLLDDEGLDLPIVDYNIRPTSESEGLVEMVPNCTSLEDLRAGQVDILPWIVEQNEHSTETAGALRERFLQSCAAYCVMSYLLGIGDRNLHNLLLRSDGSLFHIDFGFVLGQDPKPLETPKMRITTEMLAALGGQDSQAYQRFRELCSRIYNCIRRHINLFVVMLRLFVEAEPVIKENGIISEQQLMREIRRRFVPGESYQEAEIILYTHIEKSTSQSINQALIDKFHTWATPSDSCASAKSSSSSSSRSGGGGYLSAVPKTTVKTAHVLLRTLWSVTGLEKSDGQ